MFGFAEDTKDMTAAEILNYYRNRYYAEPQVTERGIVANAINDYFKESASKSAWISVDERLPDKQAQYLIVDDEGYMEVALWARQFGWFSHVNRGNEVTHWMPLPEPPKGVANGN